MIARVQVQHDEWFSAFNFWKNTTNAFILILKTFSKRMKHLTHANNTNFYTFHKFNKWKKKPFKWPNNNFFIISWFWDIYCL